MPAPHPATLDPDLIRDIKRQVDELKQQLVDDRRHLHRYPELGWQETETTRFASERLKSLGYKVTDGAEFLGNVHRLGLPPDAPGTTGLAAEIGPSPAAQVVVLRVDIDALPIREAVEGHRPATEGFSSQRPGIMHACGHDGHLAIGLAVAKIVASHSNVLKGRFRLIAQPAEEGTRGARAVLDRGWVGDADTLLAFHLALGVPSNAVAVGVRDFLATRKFKVAFSGRSAHAGKAPEEGRNALIAACHAVLGVHSLAQSGQPGIRINVGTLSAGEALNVVPSHAEFGFELRAQRQDALDTLTARARTLLDATATAHGVSAAIEVVGEATDWANTATVAGWAEAINKSTGAFPVSIHDHSFGASEDATLLLKAVTQRGGTAGYFVLGADLAGGHHTPAFDFDEEVLARGTTLMSALVLATLVTG